MANIKADLTRETATCIGASAPYDLAGCPAGAYQRFRARVTTASTCYYRARYADPARTEFEIGEGTLTHGTTDQLARTTVLKSSNADAAVAWGTGYLDIALITPAEAVITTQDGATGPASSTDNAAARFDGTGGKTLQSSAFILDDTGHVTSFGGNIKFPATQAASADANTLDDYEEGTWTPAITFGGAAVGVTYSSQVGTYTKIGNRVFISGTLALSSKGSSTGVAVITGLPFSVSGSATFAPRVTGMGTQTDWRLFGSTTTLAVYHIATGSHTQTTDANFGNSSILLFSGVYGI